MTERTTMTAQQPIYLMLRMRPPWVFIDEIRRFVESFCACACPGRGREAQLALAVHELMQNAIPHARGEDVDLTLEVSPDADAVKVTVSNPCTDEEFAALVQRVNHIYEEPDPLKAYLRAMAEAPANVRGGLGLARVRFESQLDLSVRRDGARVVVNAAGRLEAPALTQAGVVHG